MFKNKPLRWSIFYIPSRDKIIERLYQLVHEILHRSLQKIAIWLEWKLTHSLNLWVFFSKKKKKMWVIERVHVQCILSYINIYIYIFFFEQLYNLVHEIRPPSNKMATWLEWKLTQPKFLVVIQRMYYYMKNDKVIIIFII